MTRPSSIVAPRAPLVNLQDGSRSSLSLGRPLKNSMTSMVSEVQKPVASGSGVSCSIVLAEPNIFLSGFEHDGSRHNQPGGTALLRGKMLLNVTKNVKIKSVQLTLIGKARTEWPEGIPPLRLHEFEEETLRTQVLTFFNAINDGWGTEYGNQCSYSLRGGGGSSANSSSTNLSIRSANTFPAESPLQASRNPTSRELKRLSLSHTHSRSFGKSDSPTSGMATPSKGYKVFYPGAYEYSFELPIDHHQLETAKLQYGSVKWELQAMVERAGAFKPNLHGTKEVSIVRVPDQMSLETTEPISISRHWEDQLHYDIIISGKSFPIGGKIPIAFKLTPLAKVHMHKLKVYVTESIEYWTNDRRVTRKDPGRKILLLEKTAGRPLDPVWASSQLRFTSGGELTPQQRREAREAAAFRRSLDAARLGHVPEPLPDATENLLGELDLGLESYWGSTEIEANVQLPTCGMMARNKNLRLNPDCSWKNVNVYHWIKIVLRLSRADPEDPTGTRRRHFEISIDSPFTILDCRATQANTSLPEYTGLDRPQRYNQTACGCPDSATVMFHDGMTENRPSPLHYQLSSDSNLPNSGPQASGALGSDGLGISQQARPIHLLRVPSYNPPAFDAEQPPPPVELVPSATGGDAAARTQVLQTPPPQYDVVVGTPSVDGMADYFTRLAHYGFDAPEEDSDSDESSMRLTERSGRVNVVNPRTPGGRRVASRSLELARPPFTLSMDGVPGSSSGAGPSGS